MTYNDPNRDKFEEERQVHVNQSNDGMGGIIAVAAILVLLLVGGFMFFSSTPGTEPQVTQNNTTLPAPGTPTQPEPLAPVEPAAPPLAPAPTAPATNP
jgi:hypothetical protein